MTAVQLMVDEVDQIAIIKPVLRRHWTFQIRADNLADFVDRQLGATVLLRLVRTCLLFINARDARHLLVARKLAA